MTSDFSILFFERNGALFYSKRVTSNFTHMSRSPLVCVGVYYH